MSTTETVDQIRLEWTPHPGQQAILESEARFKIVACGRRWGKTACAAKWLVQQALKPDSELVWWVGPGYEVVDPGFHEILDTLPEELIENVKRSKPYEIDLVYGCRIGFRTTKSDSNVGVGLDAVVIDEAAQVSKQRWTRDLRPTLSDTAGRMMAISTPRGRNWFHDYFQRGQSPDYPDVESWTAPTYDNPHVPDSEVDAARDEVPERVFEQEYLAKFLDDAGGVFEQVRERIVADYHLDETDGTGPYATGVDFARHEDYTVIHTIDSDGTTVYHDRLRNVTWPQIQTQVERVAAQYDGPVAVDATRDNKIVSDLETAGVRVVPVTFSAKKKRELIENLVTHVEQGTVTIPDLPALISEMQLFEYDTTRAGNVRYHAPEGHHDDCVDAFALALDARKSAPQRDRPDHHGIRRL